MERIAVYPGSFDPVTNGHLDIIHRAAKLFDRLVVAVAHNSEKNALFSMEERVAMLREVCAELPNVEVDCFQGLTVDYAQGRGAAAMVKGLRAVSDFEFELQQALMNRKLSPEIETIFMMTAFRHIYLSSSIIKEVALLGGSVTGLVPPQVEESLKVKAAEHGRMQPSKSTG